MSKTIVALFDTAAAADDAVRDIQAGGVSPNAISVVANNADGTYNVGDHADDEAADTAGTGAVSGTVLGGALGLLVGAGLLAIPGIGPVLAAGPLAAAIGTTTAAVGAGALGAGIGAATGGLVGGLLGAGVPEDDANVYAEGVRRGGTLVSIDADDHNADMVINTLEQYGPVDVDTRATQYRESGWNKFDSQSEAYDRSQATNVAPSTQAAASSTLRTNNQNSDATVLPVIEEEIKVGKQEVKRGGVRVHSRMVETPVEEQVTLREEHVNVERRPVDRAVSSSDTNAFREQSLEVTEHAEEAVVSKTAQVVEEVVISKNTEQRTETIKDTVRRTDVDVQQVNGTNSTQGYAAFDKDFRTHYQTTYGTSGQSYTQYEPGYRYGYDLNSNARFQNKDWNVIEGDIRKDWERQNPNSPWEQAKDAVRFAWDRARGRR